MKEVYYIIVVYNDNCLNHLIQKALRSLVGKIAYKQLVDNTFPQEASISGWQYYIYEIAIHNFTKDDKICDCASITTFLKRDCWPCSHIFCRFCPSIYNIYVVVLRGDKIYVGEKIARSLVCLQQQQYNRVTYFGCHLTYVKAIYKSCSWVTTFLTSHGCYNTTTIVLQKLTQSFLVIMVKLFFIVRQQYFLQNIMQRHRVEDLSLYFPQIF